MMQDKKKSSLLKKAINVLKQASAGNYILAAANNARFNYQHVWARDCAVTGLSILTVKLTELYAPLINSLKLLQQGANQAGQIPSNIKVDEDGSLSKISFGGTAGRTDASFWWLIASINYLQHIEDENFKKTVFNQSVLIFNLAENWEFNGKGLMYVPMSSNWADEYITHGYVLYDQLLRYWALSLAGAYFENADWSRKAAQIKLLIKEHYLLERTLKESLYTQAQQQSILGYDLESNFIASFTPGDRVERFDAWSIGLLLILDIPSLDSKEKIFRLLKKTFSEYGSRGIPAFWPEIKPEEALYQQLLNNHSYDFKNKAGHFHNGGIWPVVNSFLVIGLTVAGEKNLAMQIANALFTNLHQFNLNHSFAEYYELYEGKPGGVKNLCFSAAGCLLANMAVSEPSFIKYLVPKSVAAAISVREQFAACALQIFNLFPLNSNVPLIIAVAGESGSGKTTLSYALKKTTEDNGLKTILLHQDDFFKLPPEKNHKAREQNFNHVGYEEVRLSLLDNCLAQIRYQKTDMLQIPKMNWLTDKEERISLDITGIKIIIVEGTYTSMLQEPDFRIFMDSNYQLTRKNRIKRGREAVTDFIEQVLIKESSLIQPHKQLADLLITNQLQIINNLT